MKKIFGSFIRKIINVLLQLIISNYNIISSFIFLTGEISLKIRNMLSTFKIFMHSWLLQQVLITETLRGIKSTIHECWGSQQKLKN